MDNDEHHQHQQPRPSKHIKLDTNDASHSQELSHSSNVSLTSGSTVINNDLPSVFRIPSTSSSSLSFTSSSLRPTNHTPYDDDDEDDEDGLNSLASSTYKRKKVSSSSSAVSSSSSGTSSSSSLSSSCPYLATINRSLLDFDMEKVCCITLLSQHIYCCLVCGKFYHGRGKQTEAYTHSVENNHHVYVSLESGKFYCLPDSYEIIDTTLQDIYYALFPAFKTNDPVRLSYSKHLSTDIHGSSYLPGFVGMNNLRSTDSISTVIHALGHIPPIRDYFLFPENYILASHLHIHPLILRFGELIRRLWSPVAFKSTVSPHEFINTVSESSNRKYGPGKVIQAAEFLTWLLNTLHSELLNIHQQYEQYQQNVTKSTKATPSNNVSSSSSKKNSTIITDIFQGEVEVTLLSSEYEEEKAQIAARKEKERLEQENMERRLNNTAEENEMEGVYERQSKSKSNANSVPNNTHSLGDVPSSSSSSISTRLPQITRTPFLFLSLDLPPAPLFKDDTGSISIPQIPIYALLSKFDGVTVTSTLRGQYRETRKYRITKLPRYLVFIIKRFNKNNFFTEKNPTIVNFPIRNLEMKPYYYQPNLTNSTISASSSSSNVSMDTTTTTDASSSSSSMSSINTLSLPPLPDENSLSTMSISQLKNLLRSFYANKSSVSSLTIDHKGIEKSELVRLVKEGLDHEIMYRQKLSLDNSRSISTKYDMIANIAHDNPPDTTVTTNNVSKATTSGSSNKVFSTSSSNTNTSNTANTLSSSNTESSNAVRLAAAASDPLIHGNYSIHLPHWGTDQWYELQDLQVKEIIPQLIGVSQSYITVFQRRNND